MISQIDKYIGKLSNQGLCLPDDATMLFLDADISANRPQSECNPELMRIFDHMNINSLLFGRPAEPYWTIINAMMKYEKSVDQLGRIMPQDCETKTFFHDIPIINTFSAAAIADALSHRKSVIIRGHGIASWGSVSPEQAFVSFSSTCFAMFVKFFNDMLRIFCDERNPDESVAKLLNSILNKLKIIQPDFKQAQLHHGAAASHIEALGMIAEAGRAVVNHRLVDSFFGNISYLLDNSIYISQTGSSLDELERCIDAVPMDGSSSAGITASSELSAHKNIYLSSNSRCVLHGHPRFSVIMSMRSNATEPECRLMGIPVVSGDIGTGSKGIMHTVPPAVHECGCTVVQGHGVFACGKADFNEPLSRMLEFEKVCFYECLSTLRSSCPASLTKFLPNLYN
ncbi:MAG: class II aldolase/adducin family protein [Nitrospiraceae bacterium]|nr:class II aldolase/adducin family protein [Nitrospiraceae bacterium]